MEDKTDLTELSRVDELSVRKYQIEILLDSAKEQLKNKAMMMLSKSFDQNNDNKVEGSIVFMERWIEDIDKEIKSL